VTEKTAFIIFLEQMSCGSYLVTLSGHLITSSIIKNGKPTVTDSICITRGPKGFPLSGQGRILVALSGNKLSDMRTSAQVKD
jgi:hypothetical protein